MTRVSNRKIQLIILLVLVCLVGTMSIAYAILSTTLNINGTAQVQDASWNVHFDNVQVNPYSVEINPVITDNNKISFSADLTTPGDFYKFSVDIVNEGSIDAMIESIIKTPELTDEEKKYLRYEIEYVDGTSINDSQLLKSGETKTISILFSYRNDIPTSNLPSAETDFDLEIVLVYVQANNTGTEIDDNEKIVKVVSGDLNTVGSEICIGEECFYLMKNDGYSVTMLAKYNLHVGYSADDSWNLTILKNSTGNQHSTARGWFNGFSTENPAVGVLSFSLTNYWANTVTTYPKYVYDSNSVAYNYIENYKTNLENKNIYIEEVRLIKLEELEALGCNMSKSSCSLAPQWVYATTYWTGEAYNSTNIWYVITNCFFGFNTYNNAGNYGIRPVIEIPLTEF